MTAQTGSCSRVWPWHRWAIVAAAALIAWGGHAVDAHPLGCNPPGHNPHCPPGPTATPELDSGELLLAGLVPIAGIWLYRRRSRRLAGGDGHTSAPPM